MHHNFRSQKAVSLLKRCGTVVSYDSVTKICNNIANAFSDNIKQFGVYVPPGLLKNKRIRASMDNIDKKVDTPDGEKGAFMAWPLGYTSDRVEECHQWKPKSKDKPSLYKF